MNTMNRDKQDTYIRYKKSIPVLLLLIITIVMFSNTITIRKPWFGVLSDGGHQWITASTIKFTNNWVDEGPFKLKFGLIKIPDSVEFQDLSSREPYASYPPGALIPIYILSIIKGGEVTPALVMKYNLLLQFLITFILALTVFIFLRQLKFDQLNSFISALIPLLFMLYSPGTMYWFQNPYWSDQAVLLPVALFILLEVWSWGDPNGWQKRIILTGQLIVMFWGAYTDWYFIFVAFVVYIVRLLRGQLGKDISAIIKATVVYTLPVIIAMAFFLWHIYSMGIASELIYKFFERTGLNNEGSLIIDEFVQRFWYGSVVNGYGKLAPALIQGSVLLFIITCAKWTLNKYRKITDQGEVGKVLAFLTCLLAPSLLQLYMFRNHSAIHDFSALKLSLPLAVIPFILAPILLFYFFNRNANDTFIQGLDLRHNRKKIQLKITVLPLMFILLLPLIKSPTVDYTPGINTYYTRLFPEPNTNYIPVGKFIKDNTNFNSIIFSEYFEVKSLPPQWLAHTKKMIYKVDSVTQILEKVHNISDSFSINLFYPNEQTLEASLIYDDLNPIVSDIRKHNGYTLVIIDGQKFLQKYSNQITSIRKN